MTIDLNTCYRASDDIIARKIEGELVIVPLKSGVGNLDSEMYALKTTGIAVWNMLDGHLTLELIIERLAAEYNAPYDEIKSDVTALMKELLKKGLVVGL